MKKHTWARWFISFPLLALFSLFPTAIPVALAHSLQPARPTIGAIPNTWAGYIISGVDPTGPFGDLAGAPFYQVDARFTIPCIDLSRSPINSSIDIWAGIGGTGGSPINRAGATIRVYQDASRHKTVAYTAWIEFPHRPRQTFGTLCGGPDVNEISVVARADGYVQVSDGLNRPDHTLISHYPSRADTRSVEFIVERKSTLLPFFPSSHPFVQFNDGHATFQTTGLDELGLGEPSLIRTVVSIPKTRRALPYLYQAFFFPYLLLTTNLFEGSRFRVYVF